MKTMRGLKCVDFGEGLLRLDSRLIFDRRRLLVLVLIVFVLRFRVFRVGSLLIPYCGSIVGMAVILCNFRIG